MKGEDGKLNLVYTCVLKTLNYSKRLKSEALSFTLNQTKVLVA